jgi:hypothetical protein
MPKNENPHHKVWILHARYQHVSPIKDLTILLEHGFIINYSLLPSNVI